MEAARILALVAYASASKIFYDESMDLVYIQTCVWVCARVACVLVCACSVCACVRVRLLCV